MPRGALVLIFRYSRMRWPVCTHIFELARRYIITGVICFFTKIHFVVNTKDNDNIRESESYPDHGQIWRNFDNPDRRKLRKFENKTHQAGQVMCFLFSEENDFSIEFLNGMVFLYVKILEYKRIFVVIHTVMQPAAQYQLNPFLLFYYGFPIVNHHEPGCPR